MARATMNAECKMQNARTFRRVISAFCILHSAFLLACTSRPAQHERLKFWGLGREGEVVAQMLPEFTRRTDRKSTRLNSSHVKISYAVFCLKKKIKEHEDII